MRAGAGAQEVTQFIVASTEPVGRSGTLEPTHRLISTFDAAVILLQSIVEVAAGAVLHAFTQRRPDRSRITVVAIRGYPVRRHIGDCFGGLEERHRRGHVTVLAEQHVDQRAAAVDGAIEIAPMPVHLDVGLVNVPAFPDLAASATAQTFSQYRRELGFLVADRLVTEHDAADQEHLRQVAQAEFVAQPPEHHESDDVRRILGPVQQALTALIELFAAGTTAKSAVALSGRLVPFRDGRRAAPNASSISLLAGGPHTQPRFHLNRSTGGRSGGTGARPPCRYPACQIQSSRPLPPRPG
jgi:hypothetical protein